MLAERRETKKQMIRQLAEQTFLTILDIPDKENKTFEQQIADYPMRGGQEEKEFPVVLKARDSGEAGIPQGHRQSHQ
jgi:hypothetical protein